MSFYQANEESFVKKCRSLLSDTLQNDKITLLKFLNIREQELLKYVVGNNAFLVFSNIYENDEYRRAFLSPWMVDADFKIDIYKINYSKRYLEINHRMVLGALMNLGISRDSIGDILITTNNMVYLIVTKEISSYVVKEFKTLHNQSITLEKVSQIDGEIKSNLLYKTDFLASLRLDVVIASMFNLSRKEALEIVTTGRIKVNQRETKNPSEELKEKDVISVKGLGKMKIVEVGGLSKRDRIFVKLGKFI